MSNQMKPRDVITYLPILGHFGVAAWLGESAIEDFLIEDSDALVKLPIYTLDYLHISYWKRGWVDAKDVRRITGDKNNEALIRRFLDLSDGADGCEVEVAMLHTSQPVKLWLRPRLDENNEVSLSSPWIWYSNITGKSAEFRFDRKIYLPVKLAKDIAHAAKCGTVGCKRDWDPDIAGDGSGGWWVTTCHNQAGEKLRINFSYLGFVD